MQPLTKVITPCFVSRPPCKLVFSGGNEGQYYIWHANRACWHLQIGGDGIFQEILNGLLHVRKSDNLRHRQAAEHVRLGHIPAGSTDAVAFSVHGTRDVLTAALHIALGDR